MKKILSLLLALVTLALALASCSNSKKSYEELDEYIVANSAELDGVHILTLGASTSEGVEYIRRAERTPVKIELILSVRENGSELRSFTLVLNKGTADLYKWYYSSSVTDNTMSGTVIPEDYSAASASLGYLTSSSSDEYEIASMSAYAKGMCDYLLGSLEGDLSAIGLTAYDLGFKDLKD